MNDEYALWKNKYNNGYRSLQTHIKRSVNGLNELNSVGASLQMQQVTELVSIFCGLQFWAENYYGNKVCNKKVINESKPQVFFHFLFHCRLYSHKYELSQHHLFWILSHFHSRIRSILISSYQFAILSRRNNVAIEHAQNIMCTHNCVLFLNRIGKKIRWSYLRA